MLVTFVAQILIITNIVLRKYGLQFMKRSLTRHSTAEIATLKRCTLLLLFVFISSMLNAQWRSASDATALLLAKNSKIEGYSAHPTNPVGRYADANPKLLPNDT